MNTWAFWSTVHYFWLVFQTWPLVVYLEGPGLYGAGIPCIGSLLVLLWVFARDIQSIHNKITGKAPATLLVKILKHTSNTQDLPVQLIAGFFLANVVIGHFSGYWSDVGYHFLDTSIIFWPVLILLDRRIPVILVYPLTFFGMLIDDVFAAGQYGHWSGDFWYGVGGAGFHDGLFVGSATAIGLSVVMLGLRILLRKSRWNIELERQAT